MEHVAATAPFELMRTRDRDPVGRRLEDLDDPSPSPTFVVAHHLGGDRLTGQRSFDEHDLAVETSGHTRPVPRRGGHPEFHDLDAIDGDPLWNRRPVRAG